jgi:hypothetical protein
MCCTTRAMRWLLRHPSNAIHLSSPKHLHQCTPTTSKVCHMIVTSKPAYPEPYIQRRFSTSRLTPTRTRAKGDGGHNSPGLAAATVHTIQNPHPLHSRKLKFVSTLQHQGISPSARCHTTSDLFRELRAETRRLGGGTKLAR